MIYEYRCGEHGKFSYNCAMNDRQAPKPCPECHTLCEFIISASRFVLEGVSGDFPTAAAAWDKRHIGAYKNERR